MGNSQANRIGFQMKNIYYKLNTGFLRKLYIIGDTDNNIITILGTSLMYFINLKIRGNIALRIWSNNWNNNGTR